MCLHVPVSCYVCIYLVYNVCLYNILMLCIGIANDVTCILDTPVLSVICAGYITEIMHSLEKYKSRRKISIFVCFTSPS